ncbi:MAG TPA: hypothetical protein VEU94_10950 [Terriglobales bacterium]|nr:hypothetical protein [Terriglobales bacterium]
MAAHAGRAREPTRPLRPLGWLLGVLNIGASLLVVMSRTPG